MRILILTFESIGSNKILHSLIKSGNCNICGIFRSKSLFAGKGLFYGIIRLFSESSYVFVFLKITETAIYKMLNLFFKIFKPRYTIPSIKDLSKRYGIPVYDVYNIN